MKKLLLSIASLLVAVTAFGQSQRLVLFEQFTQASCPPCAAANPALNAMLDNMTDQVVSIKYQTSWPGTDPMNAHNPTQVQTRVNYYSVTGVPDGFLDGGVGFSGQPSSLTSGDITTRYAVSSPFTINADFYLNAAKDSIFCHATINCTQAVSGSLVAHMVVIERNIYFTSAPGTNGEKHFEGVMKKMLPSDQGTSMAASYAPGDMLDLNYSWALANVYDKNQLALVVFVQDNATKEVLQAGYMSPRIPNDCGITAVNGDAYQCVSDVTPTVTIKNFGIDPLTTCDVNYRFDNNSITVQPWTGSIAPGASTTITLPTTTLTPGNHSFTAFTSAPNGGTDLDTNNNRVSRVYNLFTSTFTTPVANNFATTTFPSNNFAVENVDNDAYTWARSPYGFNGGGSAKMNCYAAAAGTVDNLMSPKVDFSNAISGATLTFDVAHQMYSATLIERLKVNVSTDCGATWSTIYNKAGATLATVSGYVTTAFNPVSTSWRSETVSLDPYLGNPELIFQIQSVSGYGNNIYVDNVNITDGTTSVPVMLTSSPVKLYPNPAKGEANIEVNLAKATDLNVSIINALGAKVATYNYESFSNGVIRLDISTLTSGNYLVSVSSADGVITKRLTVTE